MQLVQLRWIAFVTFVAGMSLVGACGDDGSSDPDGGSAEDDGGGGDGASGSGGSGGSSGASGGGSNEDPDAARASFEADGELVDFDGANNASYHQENFGTWRLVIVLNDVLGDKYFSIEVAATDGEEVEEGTYDCSVEEDEAAMAKTEITFRRGDGDAEEEWTQTVGEPCTVEVTSIGAIGERLTGTFSATLKPEDDPEGASLEITDGEFDVERKDF